MGRRLAIAGDDIALYFSKEKHLDHATRYDRAHEFVALIKQLWDSWEDAARAPGAPDTEQIHALDHAAQWF